MPESTRLRARSESPSVSWPQAVRIVDYARMARKRLCEACLAQQSQAMGMASDFVRPFDWLFALGFASLFAIKPRIGRAIRHGIAVCAASNLATSLRLIEAWS